MPTEQSAEEPSSSESVRNLNVEVDEQLEQALDANAFAESPAMKELSESMKQVTESFAVSPVVKAIADSMKLRTEMLGSMTGLGAAIERMKLATVLPAAQIRLPDFNATLAKIPPRPEVMTVSVLHEMHAELEGMANVLAESARQQAVLVEVTTANLTATQALIAEEQKTRASFDRSSTVQIWLTVALFAAGTVAAIAVATAFWTQLVQWWSWIQSVFR